MNKGILNKEQGISKGITNVGCLKNGIENIIIHRYEEINDKKLIKKPGYRLLKNIGLSKIALYG